MNVALPVERAADDLELLEDAVAVLLFPLPDALDELLAAEVVARLALRLRSSRSTTICVAMPA